MTAHEDEVQFSLQIQVCIRQMSRDDLPKIEWFGQFAHLRQLFWRSYKGQLDGSRHLLVADTRNFPIGRLFISTNGKNPALADGNHRGYLYSFQVMDVFQAYGIGTLLLNSAEKFLLNHRFRYATIAVAKNNQQAMRLYKRQGYTIFDEDPGQWSYRDHRGMLREVNEPCYLLEKNLNMR